jgi:hypothetical protein
MDKISQPLSNQRGSTLVITMLIMVLLTIVGVGLSNTSRTEMQITSNDQFYKIAFHNADSGINITSKLFEAFFEENFDGTPIPVTTIKSDDTSVDDTSVDDTSIDDQPLDDKPRPITFPDKAAKEAFQNEALGFDDPVEDPDDADKASVNISIDEAHNVEAKVDFRNRQHTVGSEVNTSLSFFYDMETIGQGPRGSVSNIEVVYRHVEKI